MSDSALLKHSIDATLVHKLAEGLAHVYPPFHKASFIKTANDELESKELKQRVFHVIDALVEYLPLDFSESAEILIELSKYWYQSPDNSVSGLGAWPVIDYVAVAGINHPDLALSVLEKLTSFFSAEFAIRSFYEKYEVLTLDKALVWTQDRSEHLRRLASEGLRPRLPWGKRLRRFIDKPQSILPILEKLKTDKSLYVRRSVANCLNDIAKDHPQLVIDTCQSWLNRKDHLDSETKAHLEWVIRHATRSLIKQGHPDSFVLQGYSAKPKVALTNFELDSDVIVEGGELVFRVDLECGQDKQNFVVDFCIYFQKANGSLSPKVFKLKNCLMDSGERLTLEKSFSFRPISTRRYYPGEHFVAIHINGLEKAKLPFNLH